jgi:hypothetical protein
MNRIISVLKIMYLSIELNLKSFKNINFDVHSIIKYIFLYIHIFVAS